MLKIFCYHSHKDMTTLNNNNSNKYQDNKVALKRFPTEADKITQKLIQVSLIFQYYILSLFTFN